jgi:hypothetical protein
MPPELEPERWEASREERRATIRRLVEATVLRVLARERGRPVSILEDDRAATLAPHGATIDVAVGALEQVSAHARAEAISAVAEGLHANAADHEMIDQAIEYGITGALTKRGQ